MQHEVVSTSTEGLNFLWLEITGKCQLECTHCYASSGPSGTHGSMTREDWMCVIDQAARLGVPFLQFIGGEPTLHPDFAVLLQFALDRGIKVEVFSNLVHITPSLWDLFSQPGVSLATSWYSDDQQIHARITSRTSFFSTKSNIEEAVRRYIPIRVGVIGIEEGQHADEAKELLIQLGVSEHKIGYDDIRQIGRGARDKGPSPQQLCGNCADGVLAISSTGEVWPCVFSRWIPLGNVLNETISDIINGKTVKQKRNELKQFFQEQQSWPCEPKCSPRCSPSCSPCAPGNRCWPYYD